MKRRSSVAINFTQKYITFIRGKKNSIQFFRISIRISKGWGSYKFYFKTVSQLSVLKRGEGGDIRATLKKTVTILQCSILLLISKKFSIYKLKVWTLKKKLLYIICTQNIPLRNINKKNFYEREKISWKKIYEKLVRTLLHIFYFKHYFFMLENISNLKCVFDILR